MHLSGHRGFCQQGQGVIPLQQWPVRKLLLADRTLWADALRPGVPEISDAVLTEGVSARYGHGHSELFYADGAVQILRIHSPRILIEF